MESNQKLILLVGASGSGKTTIAKELEQLGYNIIHSFTTRKEREEGEWGHIFIDENIDSKDLEDALNYSSQLMYKGVSIIAFFNDYKRNEIYFATEQQYQGKGTSIYIVDPDGANQVKDNVKDAEVVTIFLMADESTRLDRLRERHNESANKNKWFITNVVNRIIKDREIFKTCKCDYVVDANRGLDEVFEDLIEIIGA